MLLPITHNTRDSFGHLSLSWRFPSNGLDQTNGGTVNCRNNSKSRERWGVMTCDFRVGAFACLFLAVSGVSAAVAQTASGATNSLAAATNSSSTDVFNSTFRPFIDYWQQLCKQPNSPANTAMYHCEPGVSFYAGVMALQRSRSGGVVATPPTGTLGTLFDAGSLQYGWDAVPEVVVQVRPIDGWAVEGRWFADRSTVADPASIPGVTTFRTSGIGVTILGGGTLEFGGSSQLSSAELTVVKQLTPTFSLLAGYRRISLTDSVTTNLVGTGLNLGAWKETNSLNGSQIGARLAFATPGFSALQFDVTGKWGYYTNSATSGFTSNIVSNANSTGSTPSYVTEANLGITLQILPNVALRAGLMMLWLNHLNLAGAAAAATTQVAGGTSSPVTTNGNLHYSGATGQLNVAF